MALKIAAPSQIPTCNRRVLRTKMGWNTLRNANSSHSPGNTATATSTAHVAPIPGRVNRASVVSAAKAS